MFLTPFFFGLNLEGRKLDERTMVQTWMGTFGWIVLEVARFLVVGRKTDHSNLVFLGNVFWDLSLMKCVLGKTLMSCFSTKFMFVWFHC